MDQSFDRSWELNCLIALYFLTAVVGLQRLVSTIQNWSLLVTLVPFTPFYLVISGILWFALGIISAIWLWFNIIRIYPVVITSTSIIVGSYWFERLFLVRNAPAQANLLFSAAITIFCLVFVFIVIFLPAQQKRFSHRNR